MASESSNANRLLAVARATAAHAYSPYSGFKVGSAILLESGEIIGGCNVECSSYGLTNCAERTAIFSAVAEHGAHIRVESVAIVSTTAEAVYPCGACREVLNNFGCKTVILERSLGSDRDPIELALAELLPYGK